MQTTPNSTTQPRGSEGLQRRKKNRTAKSSSPSNSTQKKKGKISTKNELANLIPPALEYQIPTYLSRNVFFNNNIFKLFSHFLFQEKGSYAKVRRFKSGLFGNLLCCYTLFFIDDILVSRTFDKLCDFIFKEDLNFHLEKNLQVLAVQYLTLNTWFTVIRSMHKRPISEGSEC